MRYLNGWLERADAPLPAGTARLSIRLLRICLGIVFLWFGVLKFFPELSPAQDLATRTIETLSFGLVKPSLSLPVLAAWECLIGLGLITKRFLRVTLILLFVQMLGTFTPILLFPQETWVRFPTVPTMEGQYILKNIVLVSSALVIGAMSQGKWMALQPASNLKTDELPDQAKLYVGRTRSIQGE
jgi:uncharacterized membrane protein YphA (DoxX/SURF4 family)